MKITLPSIRMESRRLYISYCTNAIGILSFLGGPRMGHEYFEFLDIFKQLMAKDKRWECKEEIRDFEIKTPTL